MEEGHLKCRGKAKRLLPTGVLFWVGVSLFFVQTDAEPQFRSEQTGNFYHQPYNRPSTSRPDSEYPLPNHRRQDSYGVLYRDQNYRFPDRSFTYRGNEYENRHRGSQRYGTSQRDPFRLNYDSYDSNNVRSELRNTIFDRWRPDLQGEQRPGETPGINLPLAEDVFVSTDSGKIQGFYVYLYDKPGARHEERPVNKPLDLQRHYLNVTVFLGIPYAQPPYKEGRFKPPRYVRNWHTTWQAIDYSAACPQNLKYVGATRGIRNGINEDCLYLNIFTPSLSVNARERYAVMFHIHGGDFDHGAGSQFPGHMLSAWGEVVVVTINYRLGALGFLSTGDYHSPGNYGLMDMALALEWVYNNIRFFNGDRERITVFGPGAGGAAAGLLAVLPKTRDWVHQVLAESGSPLAEWAAIDDPYRVQNTSKVFGLEMGCNVENSYNLLHCLVNRDYEEITAAPITPDVGTFAWSPVVDGNFTVPGDSWYEEWNEKDWHILPDLPIHLYQHNHHHSLLRYLTGVNRDEAAEFVYDDIRLSKNNYVVTEDFFDERAKDWVKHYNYTLNPQGAQDAIKWMYTFWPDPHNTTHIREQYIHMLSDALYKSGVDQIVKLLVNSTGKFSVPTYYYVLNTTVEALKLPLWREVPHNMEYYFVTGAPFMDPEFYPERIRVARQQWSEGDRNISRFMMKTFANFAKWGNPTQEQVKPIEVNWEPTIEGSLKYLNINNTCNTSMLYNYRQKESTFWYEYMPMVVREYVPTPPPPRNPWIDMKEPVTATMYALIVILVAFLVILFICCGLWKSAKRQQRKAESEFLFYKSDSGSFHEGEDRPDDSFEYFSADDHGIPCKRLTSSRTSLQRNKALDDLSYYSNENLALTKDEDYEVREYLEKLNNLRNQNTPSRSGTLNTVVSSAHMTQSSRPVTPQESMISSNGKIVNHRNLSEPDHSSQFSTKRSIHGSREQSLNTVSDKPIIMELEEPSRIRKGHSQIPASYEDRPIRRQSVPYDARPDVQNYNSHHNKGFVDAHLGIPELPPYTEAPIHNPPTSGPTTSSPTLIGTSDPHLQPVYAQPHAHVNIPTQPPRATTLTNEYEPPPRVFYEPDPGPVGDIKRGSEVAELPHRPVTPAGSAVRVEISMKPSRSVGTISSTSGHILNTDL